MICAAKAVEMLTKALRRGLGPATIAATLLIGTAWAQPPALVGDAGGDDVLWEARTALEQFRTMVGVVQQAQARGDAEAFARATEQAQQHLDRARELFDRGDAGESEDVDTLRAYAEVLRMSQDTDLAAEISRRVTELDPEDARAWLTLGRDLMLMGGGDAREALEALRTAVRLDPEPSITAEAWTAQGILLFGEGLYELSSSAFEQALEANDAFPPALIGRAALWIRDGKLHDAANLFDTPDLIPPQLGGQLRGMIDKALSDFTQRRIWFDDTAENHAAYAKLLVRFERVEESVLPLERALALDDGNYVHWNLLASVCRSPNVANLERAREAYLRSLELNPDQPRTRQALEELEEQGVTGEAEPEPESEAEPRPSPAIEPPAPSVSSPEASEPAPVEPADEAQAVPAVPEAAEPPAVPDVPADPPTPDAPASAG